MDAFIEKPTRKVVSVLVKRNTGNNTIKLPYNNKTKLEFIRNFSASYAGCELNTAELYVDGDKKALSDLVEDHVDSEIIVDTISRERVIVCMPGLRKQVFVGVKPNQHSTFGEIAASVANRLNIPSTALKTFKIVDTGTDVCLDNSPTIANCGSEWEITFDCDTADSEHPYLWMDKCALFDEQ